MVKIDIKESHRVCNRIVDEVFNGGGKRAITMQAGSETRMNVRTNGRGGGGWTVE